MENIENTDVQISGDQVTITPAPLIPTVMNLSDYVNELQSRISALQTSIVISQAQLDSENQALALAQQKLSVAMPQS